MNNKDEILELFSLAKKTIKKAGKDKSLPSSAYFLNEDIIVCLPNDKGDMRYPYSHDGLTLWAYASGYIVSNESSFYIFPQTLEGKESYISFFGGIKNKDKYDYLSISGVNDTVFGLSASKMTIFTPSYALYIREYKGIIFYLQVSLSLNKEILLDSGVINNSKSDKDIYLSAYLNPLLLHSNFESEEAKWFKTSKIYKNHSILSTKEDISRQVHLFNYALIRNNCSLPRITTSSRMEYVGNKNGSVNGSLSLTKGEFVSKEITSFIDASIYGDLVKKSLKSGEHLNIAYNIKIAHEDFKEVEPFINNEKDYALLKEIDNKVFNKEEMLKMEFINIDDERINSALFNKFLHSVIRQVDYCSKAKNSSLSLLGVRDSAQMIEASLMWDKVTGRAGIIKLFNFIDPTGRAPRQLSIPQSGEDPLMDNREFIDQGQWLISLVHKYLCYTGDKSILDEQCSYCILINRNGGHIIQDKDSLFIHLEKIASYLISNIDEKTNCLKTLYGDWNDAVDGLGTSDDPNARFGNGVSTMATLHLYKNLLEMSEICAFFGKNGAKYLEIRENLAKGIFANLIVKKDGERRIVHGFGNNQSFYVGSFVDVDHKSRHSATSNAFYVISGLYEKDPSLKADILKAYKSLDSKYGIKTFDQYFDPKDASAVGRIVNLPKGTAENAATYIHGAMFCVKSLAMMGESKLAFDQIAKLIPITHERISVSSFVMPNSYGYNPDLGIDGQSMNDWYTGSSNTLLKTMVDDVFGVQPKIDGNILIKPLKDIPAQKAKISVEVRDKIIILEYINQKQGHRVIKVNGKIINDNLIVINANKLRSRVIHIKVID